MSKILIVDDDQDILTVASLLLKMNGFEVDTTCNGNKTIECIKNNEPDLVLLDVNLGNEDGRMICKKLKSNSTTNHIPIVLFSANHDIDKSYSDCGADDFIAKPFDSMAFIEALKKHLA